MYYDQVNDIYLASKMGQIIKLQRPVSSAYISGLYVILEAAFTIALLGVLLYKYTQERLKINVREHLRDNQEWTIQRH